MAYFHICFFTQAYLVVGWEDIFQKHINILMCVLFLFTAQQPQAPWAGTQQLSPSIPQQAMEAPPEQNPPATAVEAS